MMKIKFHFIALLSFMILLYPHNGYTQTTIIKVFQNYKLIVYVDGEYREIIKESKGFYGYGILDENRIFIAYQPYESSGALAVVMVHNLKEKKNKILFKVSNAGETSFDINNASKKIVYTDPDGIKVLTIHKDNSYTVTKVFSLEASASAASFPFWIDEKTIGFTCSDEKPGEVFRKLILK